MRYNPIKLAVLAGFLSVLTLVPAVADETTYATGRVLENLRRFSEYARKKSVDWKGSTGDAPARISESWNPDAYQGYLNTQLKGMTPDPAPVTLKTSERLLNPTVETLTKLSSEISSQLTRQPANPVLHEHAALLVATMILREAAGRFYDTRELMSRVTAHLAIARYLQPDPSPVGVLAHTILIAEQGRVTDALKQANALPEALKDWGHVLEVRLTGDWRNAAASQTILYRLAHTRAFLRASSGQASQKIVDSIAAQDQTIRGRTDWYRTFLEDPPTRKYMLSKLNQALQLEADEMSTVVKAFSMTPTETSISISLLNAPAGFVVNADPVGLPRIEVLNWGLWAGHCQRHLCHALNFVLGEQMIERTFSGLDLYPFIILQHKRKPDGVKRHTFREAIDLCRDKPYLVNAVNRLHLSGLLKQATDTDIDPFYPQSSTPYISADVRDEPTLGFPPSVRDLRRFLPMVTGWVVPRPGNSLYRAEKRISLMPESTRAEVAKINPYMIRLVRKQVKESAASDLETLEELAGSTAHYNLYVMREILDKLPINSADYHELLDRIVTISPLATLLKANMYFLAGDIEKADTWFKKAVETDVPPSMIAQSAGWVVEHRLAGGKTDQALDLAKLAAGSGGAGQHQRYIQLLERVGKSAEAEKTAINLQKHFPSTVPLIRFYVVQGRLNNRNVGEKNVSTALGAIKFRPRMLESERNAAFKAAETIIFPGGKRTFRQRPGKPGSGLMLRQVMPGTKAVAGDIVVAFNRIALRDIYQYHFVRRESDAPQAVLTLWNKDRGYYTAEVNLAEWDTLTRLTFVDTSDDRVAQRLNYAATSGKLNLSGLGLKTIPDSVFEMKNLTVLNLSGNPLGTLPDAIGTLTTLERLDVSNCALSKLPAAIGKLENLVAFRAGENNLTTLPDACAGMKKLELLYLKENDIAVFPDCILTLPALNYLVFSNNHLRELPAGLSGLTALRGLSLGRNRFETFPKALVSIPSLETLILLDNQLEELPETLGQLTKLKRLDLRGNRLTDVPKTITALTALSQLQLGDNCFTTVPEALWGLSALEELDFGGNRLTEIPPEISSMASLKHLIISSNRLAKFPPTIGDIKSLREVEYGGNLFAPEHILVIINLAKHVKFSGSSYARK